MLQKRKKKKLKIWNINVDNTSISKLFETKTNSKCLIGYSGKDIRALILIKPKMSGCVTIFKLEDKNNKLMSLHIYDGKLFEKYKAIWTKIEDFKNVKFNALPVYDDKNIKPN